MNQIGRIILYWLPTLVLTFWATGCGEEQSGTCAENDTRGCQCADMKPGYQSCTTEGIFSDCICTDSSSVITGNTDIVSPVTAGSVAGNETIDSARDGGVVGTMGAPGTAAANRDSGGSTADSTTMAGSAGMVVDAGLVQVDSSTSTAVDAGTAEKDGSTGSAGSAGTDSEPPENELEPFSFFVVSYEAMQRLSGSPNGFGGDLRYGEAGGIAGADKICTEVAEYSMKGAAQKGWRAFLSATTGGPDGGPIHAIERVGSGPWYDRLGRTVALTTSDLKNMRPLNADPAIVNDLPNEYGVPNSAPDGFFVDNHHVLTGSNEQGRLAENNPRVTCQNWTSAVGADGQPRVGFSWPRGFPPGAASTHWISGLNVAGCAAVINLIENGPGDWSTMGVGSAGGYGAIYCFALTP